MKKILTIIAIILALALCGSLVVLLLKLVDVNESLAATNEKLIASESKIGELNEKIAQIESDSDKKLAEIEKHNAVLEQKLKDTEGDISQTLGVIQSYVDSVKAYGLTFNQVYIGFTGGEFISPVCIDEENLIYKFDFTFNAKKYATVYVDCKLPDIVNDKMSFPEDYFVEDISFEIHDN